MQKITLICGGPGSERGISLNSTRCVFDHLDKTKYDIRIVYVNPQLARYVIPHHLIYSNTPLDFDYYLKASGTVLDDEEKVTFLQEQDIVFPLIHGLYGEDGQLQEFLEQHTISFLGSSSEACRLTSDKYLCQKTLAAAGFFTLSPLLYSKGDDIPALAPGKRVIKPLNGGSSLGIHFFTTTEELQALGDQVFAYQDTCVIEPFCEGREFTIMVMDTKQGYPLALLPSEMDFLDDSFFDYRKKYLPTNSVRYHTPARFGDETVEQIRQEAQEVFSLFGLQSGARLDGWILDDGRIWRSDINAIMGMEQNSFLFQQTALLGLSHKQTIEYLMHHQIHSHIDTTKKQAIPVVFGGNTAERHVSVMSGTNVVMKLDNSNIYYPKAVFMDTQEKLWLIPHYLCLLHTVEEIEEKKDLCRDTNFVDSIQKRYQDPLLQALDIRPGLVDKALFVPRATSWEELAQVHDFIFLGLHGGSGENGVIQARLDALGVCYNGPGTRASALCSDKQASKDCLDAAGLPGVRTARGLVVDIQQSGDDIWEKVITTHCGNSVIIKPNDDGCSAGVIHVTSEAEFFAVLGYYKHGISSIPAKAINDHHGQIEMPSSQVVSVLVEEYIVTDDLSLDNLSLHIEEYSGYIEATVGVIGTKENMRALSPSQSVAESNVLSLEEKFMGGTGVNLTPPPHTLVSPEAIKTCKQSIASIAETLGITGYSRIDVFLHRITGEVIFIEANTLPGLTPSTVIYHQALAETPQLFPVAFIEELIRFGLVAS